MKYLYEALVHVTEWLSVGDGDKIIKQNGCLCLMAILYVSTWEYILWAPALHPKV